MNRLFFSALVLTAFLPLTAHADLIKQGATYSRDILVTDTTGANVNSLATGAFTVTQSQAGGAPATVTPTITYKAAGHYNLAYTAAMTATLGSSALVITASGAVQTDVGDQVVAFDPNDASLLGLSGVATAPNLATANAALTSHTAILATITPSAIVAAMKADTLLAKVFNRAKQAYTYNLTTHVITLMNDDGTTMGTVTLTIDPTTNTITSKQ